MWVDTSGKHLTFYRQQDEDFEEDLDIVLGWNRGSRAYTYETDNLPF